MDESFSEDDLDSKRGLSALEIAIWMGKAEKKAAEDLLRGHPCADGISMPPHMEQEIQEPPDDDTDCSA